jgi:hypothetical protein
MPVNIREQQNPNSDAYLRHEIESQTACDETLFAGTDTPTMTTPAKQAARLHTAIVSSEA